MKIVLTSHGTRGDVQPYLALAVGLQQHGHQVTLATSENYTAWIQAYGVGVQPTQFNVQEFTQLPATQAVLKSRNPVRIFRALQDLMRLGAAAMATVWAACQTADFVIQSPTSVGALEAAQLRGIPVAFAYPVPFAPTAAFPSFFLGQPHFSLGAGYNRLTHAFMHAMLWRSMSGPLTDPLRKKLGLRPWRAFGEQLAYARQQGIPGLYGFSAHVLPRPADWDALQHITGYWFLAAPADWQPPPVLERFLASGPPPVYVGYGSISWGDPVTNTQRVLRALEMSGQRGLILTGWGGLTALPASANVLFVEHVPHAWLFPRVAAVVHHGGAGSTAAGLRAGVPNIVTPFAADQPAWAKQVVQLGVGPRAPAIQKITAAALATALQGAVHDPALRARAAALGEKIRAEDGVARAVEIIERTAAVSGAR